MTAAQKSKWIQEASAEELLNEYETLINRRAKDSTLLFDAEILESLGMLRNAILDRMN